MFSHSKKYFIRIYFYDRIYLLFKDLINIEGKSFKTEYDEREILQVLLAPFSLERR